MDLNQHMSQTVSLLEDEGSSHFSAVKISVSAQDAGSRSHAPFLNQTRTLVWQQKTNDDSHTRRRRVILGCVHLF